jgi:hypothetical protein
LGSGGAGHPVQPRDAANDCQQNGESSPQRKFPRHDGTFFRELRRLKFNEWFLHQALLADG